MEPSVPFPAPDSGLLHPQQGVFAVADLPEKLSAYTMA